MKLELDLLKDSEQTFDALLNEINKQKSWFLNFKVAAAKASIANLVGTTIPATDAAA